jgi:hypothetical protein
LYSWSNPSKKNLDSKGTSQIDEMLNEQVMREMYIEDATCNICFEILVEPVKLLCNHELCIICATSLIESKSYSCPMCREKIPQIYWSHLPLLINEERWTEIKQTLPNEVVQRLPDIIEFHKRETKKVSIT